MVLNQSNCVRFLHRLKLPNDEEMYSSKVQFVVIQSLISTMLEFLKMNSVQRGECKPYHIFFFSSSSSFSCDKKDFFPAQHYLRFVPYLLIMFPHCEYILIPWSLSFFFFFLLKPHFCKVMGDLVILSVCLCVDIFMIFFFLLFFPLCLSVPLHWVFEFNWSECLQNQPVICSL